MLLSRRLRNKHNLKWLRVSMSYHKFANLRKIFSGDLTGMKVIKSIEDIMDRVCNCNKDLKIDGECIFGGNRRKSEVIYKYECKVCGAFYIGNTQNHVKQR